jgi:hypothetical protein
VPAQSASETPRSLLVPVTGADLSGGSRTNSSPARLLVSLGIVLLGLGLVSLGVKKTAR